MNQNTIKSILKLSKPTKEQIIYVLALVDSNEDYESHFYSQVNSINWFKILKLKGVFKTNNIPQRTKLADGKYVFPSWYPLVLFKKISESINGENDIDVVDDLINIVNDCINKEIDNRSVWYYIIEILTNLPNEKITVKLLGTFSELLNERDYGRYMHSKFAEALFPKFLNESASKEDIEKAEAIFKFIFSIHQDKQSNDTKSSIKDYISKLQSHSISEIIGDTKLVKLMSQEFSNEAINYLANNIKIMTQKSYLWSMIYFEGEDCFCEIKVEEDNLLIEVFNDKNREEKYGSELIANFENINRQEIKNGIVKVLKSIDIPYVENEVNNLKLSLLIKQLFTGDDDPSFDNSINAIISEKHYSGIREDTQRLFIKLLIENLKCDKEKAIKWLKMFGISIKYRLSFFRQAVLFIIKDNWEDTKDIFWEMIKDQDRDQLFSTPTCKYELSDLLTKHQQDFDKTQKSILLEIIENGSKRPYFSIDERYWERDWYYALKEINPFNKKFKELSEILDDTSEPPKSGIEINYRKADIPPLILEALRVKTTSEIATYIKEYQPEDRWKQPNVLGLSTAVGKLVKEEPQRILDGIELFEPIAYPYVYYIIHGYISASRNNNEFDWEALLSFIHSYISQDGFYKDELIVENEDTGINHNGVIEAIIDLLNEGISENRIGLDISFFEQSRLILDVLIENLSPNYPELYRYNDFLFSYQYNPKSRKVIEVIIELYRKFKNKKFEESKYYRGTDIFVLIDDLLDEKIIDSYIVGYEFFTLFSINKSWLFDKVETIYGLDNASWLPFMDGILKNRIYRHKESYNRLYKHYKRLLSKSIEVKSFQTTGLINNITHFYLRGFEELNENSLMKQFVDSYNLQFVKGIVNNIIRFKDYFKRLNSDEAEAFELKIIILWRYLVEKLSDNTEDGKDLLGLLNEWSVFLLILDDEKCELINNSSQYLISSSRLIDNLIRLKKSCDPKYIGGVLLRVNINNFGLLTDSEKKKLKALANFLYENDQEITANEFCENMAKRGHEFLNGIYLKNNS